MIETFKEIDLYVLETLFPLEVRDLGPSNFLSLRFINPFVSFVLFCLVGKEAFVLPVVQVKTPMVLTTISGGGFLNKCPKCSGLLWLHSNWWMPVQSV